MRAKTDDKEVKFNEEIGKVISDAVLSHGGFYMVAGLCEITPNTVYRWARGKSINLFKLGIMLKKLGCESEIKKLIKIYTKHTLEEQ